MGGARVRYYHIAISNTIVLNAFSYVAMVAPMKISFYDKLEFEARNDYLTCERSVPKPAHPPVRGVIFQPKYHQQPLTSPKLTFHCKKARSGNKELSRGRTRDYSSKAHSAPLEFGKIEVAEQPKFHRFFQPLGIRDGLVEKARYYLFTSAPYTNPKPHDFRPVSNVGVAKMSVSFPLFLKLDEGPSHLRTLKTPDPMNIVLRTEGLSVIDSDEGEFIILKESHTCIQELFSVTANGLHYLKTTWDSVNVGQFCTRKTPEPHHVPSLHFPKGVSE